MKKKDNNNKVDDRVKEMFTKELFGDKDRGWKIYVTYEKENEIYNSEIYKKLEIYKIYNID